MVRTTSLKKRGVEYSVDSDGPLHCGISYCPRVVTRKSSLSDPSALSYIDLDRPLSKCPAFEVQKYTGWHAAP